MSEMVCFECAAEILGPEFAYCPACGAGPVQAGGWPHRKQAGRIPKTVYEQWVEADRLRQQLKDQASKVNARLEKLSKEVLEEMERRSESRVTVDGATLFPKRRRYARWKVRKDVKRLAAACRSAMLMHLVQESVNMNSLSSWLRHEHDEIGEDCELGDAVPPALREIIEFEESYTVGARGNKT